MFTNREWKKARAAIIRTQVRTSNYARLGPASAYHFWGQGFQLYPLNNWDEHLGDQGTIYDFNKRNKSVDLAASQVTTAQDRLELAKSGLSYRTIQTFYAILFLEKSIQVQDEEIKNLNDHLLMTQKKVQAGSATDFDVLTTQVRVAAAENSKINLQNNLENTKVCLPTDSRPPGRFARQSCRRVHGRTCRAKCRFTHFSGAGQPKSK